MQDRMEAISATARIRHTSCWRCPYWTVDGYRSDTQGLPPRYADRGSAERAAARRLSQPPPTLRLFQGVLSRIFSHAHIQLLLVQARAI